MKPATKSLCFATFFTLLSLSLALGVAEVVIRLKNSSMKNYDIEMWRYARELKQRSDNPNLSHVHIPDSSAVLQSVTIRTNAYGLRGGPVALEKKPGERRILFLGSSITLGWGVPEEETMTALLEKRFREVGKENVTVLNAGIGNYNAPRYTELFFTQLEELKPTDIVIHYFVRDAEELDSGGGNWLLRNSQLAMTAWIAWQRAFEEKKGENALLEHYQKVYAKDAKGYQDMQAALLRLAEYAHKNKVRVYLAMVPDVHNLKNYPFGFIHRDMIRIANADGFTYVDLLPAFGNLEPKDIWAMPGDPHPNALGHKLMSNALFPVLNAVK